MRQITLSVLLFSIVFFVPFGGYAASVPINGKTVTLSLNVSGNGLIRSTAGFQECKKECTTTLPAGTYVTLSAQPENGYIFRGWSGGCSGTFSCTFALWSDKGVTATFESASSTGTAPAPSSPSPSGTTVSTLSVTVSGPGTVYSSGGFKECSSLCMTTLSAGSYVTLSARPKSGAVFTGWSGACSGKFSCTVAVRGGVSVTATFASANGDGTTPTPTPSPTPTPTPAPISTYTLSVIKSGQGTVTSSDNAINCGSLCSKSFEKGTVITLSASAASGSAFKGWSGACSGNAECTVTVTQNSTVSALFAQDIIPSLTFTASTSSLSPGSEVTLKWTTSNATTCQASNGWSGSVAINSGSSVQKLESTKTFDLECFSATGNTTGKKSVRVNVFSRPKVAILDYGNFTTSTVRQETLAKFNFIILGMWPSMGESNMTKALNHIVSQNKNAQIAQYTILSQWYPPEMGGDAAILSNEIEKNDWWVRDVSTGSRVRMDTGYNAYEVNSTTWTKPNTRGERYPQFLARYQKETFFGKFPQIKYMFNDNTFLPNYYYQWNKNAFGDWKKSGTNQTLGDGEMNSAVADGFVAYWDAFRAQNPGVKIIGNAGAGLDVPQFQNQMEGAFLECLIGKSYSKETWRPNVVGWTENLEEYRKALRMTRAPHDVVYQVCSSTANNFALMRFGLATALLDNGWFLYSEDYNAGPKWFDEFDVPLGKPVQNPPTAATENGIWTRKYENGIVLVNPSKTSSATISVGAGYRHMWGSQDPQINDGKPVSSVTLPPRAGLILLKQ